jgi:hypothetical protein
MLSAALLVLLVAASGSAAPAASSSSADYPTAVAPARDVLSWNQSQNGKVNLQVSLKDVQIFALLNSDLYDDDNNNNAADVSPSFNFFWCLIKFFCGNLNYME